MKKVEENKETYNYFVSFTYVNEDNKVETGNLTVKWPKKIEYYEDVMDLQAFLQEKIIPLSGTIKDQLVVMGWQEIKVKDEDGE